MNEQEKSSPRLLQLFGFLEASPEDPFINFAIAKEHEGLGNEDKALSFYKKLTEQSPDYVGTYYHYAKLLGERGEESEAFVIYDKGITVAQKLGDQHALSELKNARLNLELE